MQLLGTLTIHESSESVDGLARIFSEHPARTVSWEDRHGISSESDAAAAGVTVKARAEVRHRSLTRVGYPLSGRGEMEITHHIILCRYERCVLQPELL
jgi:hypothetical protein